MLTEAAEALQSHFRAADLEYLEKRLPTLKKKSLSGGLDFDRVVLPEIDKLRKLLEAGEPLARDGTGPGSFHQEYLESFGLENIFAPTSSVLTDLLHHKIRKASLGLSIFYTAGDMEARSWLFPRDWTCDAASGAIHRDFPKTFNAALVWKYNDIVTAGAKLVGSKVKKGKDYVFEDAEDVVEFQLNKNSGSGGQRASMKL
eukprot:g3319.t1